MNKKIIFANWKMNPQTVFQAKILAQKEDLKGVVIFPPHPFIGAIAQILKKAKLGAQDLFWEEKGAFTGQVSPSQLKSLGVKYVLVGHSEKRAFGDSDEFINKKIKKALNSNFKVILCLGENWSIRKKGFELTKKFIKNQIIKDLKNCPQKLFQNLFIAYEPIWAIGTGHFDHPKETIKISSFIKDFFRKKFKIENIPVIYGGSVDSKNAFDFLSEELIDGLLIGGASLKPKEIKKIWLKINKKI